MAGAGSPNPDYYDEDSDPLACLRETTEQITVGQDHNTAIVKLKQIWDENGFPGVVWDSGTVLVKYLMDPNQNINLNKKYILELGSGRGLTSIVLSLLSSPTRIVATERKLGLPLLKSNVQLNKAKVEVDELDWSHPSYSSLRKDRWDIIIGVDLLNEEKDIEPLIETLDEHTSPYTVVYLASCRIFPRHRKFYTNLVDRGFRVCRLFYGAESGVQLFKIGRAYNTPREVLQAYHGVSRGE